MKPHKVYFYAYADDEADILNLQKALNDFVREKYNEGTIVTADKLTRILQKFRHNYLVSNYLKS